MVLFSLFSEPLRALTVGSYAATRWGSRRSNATGIPRIPRKLWCHYLVISKWGWISKWVSELKVRLSIQVSANTGCAITEFLGVRDTQEHFLKPSFWTRVSDWTPWKNQGFGKPKDYSSIRKAWKSFFLPKGNRIIFRNFSPCNRKSHSQRGSVLTSSNQNFHS